MNVFCHTSVPPSKRNKGVIVLSVVKTRQQLTQQKCNSASTGELPGVVDNKTGIALSLWVLVVGTAGQILWLQNRFKQTTVMIHKFTTIPQTGRWERLLCVPHRSAACPCQNHVFFQQHVIQILNFPHLILAKRYLLTFCTSTLTRRGFFLLNMYYPMNLTSQQCAILFCLINWKLNGDVCPHFTENLLPLLFY